MDCCSFVHAGYQVRCGRRREGQDILKGLTKKQRQVFDFIRSQIVKTNRPPTMREIGREFDMSSTGSVRDVLRALVKKGFIQKDSHVSRGIRIKRGPGPLSGDIVEVPVVETITPGTPVSALDNIEHTFMIDKSMLPEGEVFAVKVKGDSMAEAGIRDGDSAFVRRQSTCRPGHIVAVASEGKITFREFSRKGDRITLRPANRRLKAAVMDAKKFGAAILGVLAGIYRRF
jgi:repressor LexA